MNCGRRVATAVAGVILAGGLAACGGGGDKVEQSDTGSAGTSSTSAPEASMDPGMDHSDMPSMDDMVSGGHSGGH